MRKFTTVVLCALSAIGLNAQNPIVKDQFTADPTARVFNGKIYLYPSHDIVAPKLDHLRPDWFCMADYHVFTSDDLVEWTDLGTIVSQENVPWGNPQAYSMWAPDCVEKNGRYYFYFPDAPSEGRGFAVGVAVADKPEGPFFVLPRPIEGIMGIDPCVLIDDDGQSYIYWQGMGLRGAKLADDMTSLASAPEAMQGIPQGFVEGPFAFKRNGIYYLTFPWVEEENSTETLAYCVSDNPLGPWEFKGKIMDKSPTGCWTNHHSIVEYNDQWYLFYHHNDYSPKFDKNRSARIDSLHFNADGSIQKVIPTLRGVGVANARTPLHIDRYSAISKGAKIDYIDSLAPFEGWKTVFTRKGAQVRFDKVDFSTQAPSLITAKAKGKGKAVLRVNIDSPQGLVAGRLAIKPSQDWAIFQGAIDNPDLTGIHDIFVTLESGKNLEVDYIGYDQLPWKEGAFTTGKYRNLFAEMGYAQADIDAKLQEIYSSLFEGPNRVYFEVGDDMAYISDLKNHDVRTEGMSYGMMIAVQLDKKDVFDRLWRWSQKYMQHTDGPLQGYFAWSCKTDGTRNAQGPASDGELYYITSLIFASNRWGNDTGIDYLAEAQHILNHAMMKSGMDSASPLIDTHHKLITFTPDPMGGAFTDPSYHLPAFYEVWAMWANDGRSKFWRQCAAKSREYLHAATHPITGLNPDYSNYDGSLMTRRGFGRDFRFDSWRVPMNIALDYSWSCADRQWQQAYANRIQNFLYSQGVNDFVDQYQVDGTPVTHIMRAGEHQALRHSLGLVATSAAVSLAATDPKCREFVDAFWNAKHEPYDDGYFDAYYDGLLRLFAFMHLSGNYRIITPQQ